MIKKVQKYYNIILVILGMIFVGYSSFDNWASILIFGIGVGGVLGVIIDLIGKNKK